MPELAVTYRKRGDLKPYDRNARTHSDAQIAQIAASIREFGWTNPVLIDERDRIIAGHGRVAAATLLGQEEVPTICIAGLTDAQRRALVIADNKLALNAGWDDALLASELETLRAEDFDLGLIGFSAHELDALRPTATDVDPDAADVIPELQSTVVSAPGDIWTLGDHRIMCGDCRNPEHVARLIGQRKVNLAFTSPPYAEQRDYDASSGFRPIPPDEYVEWFSPVAANVAAHLASDGSWFVNIKPGCDGLDTFLYVFDLVIAHAREWGWHFATEFCWERAGVPKSVTQRFKNQFEPVYQFTRGRWKMRPDAVRHESSNVPRAGGPGSGNTSWKDAQGDVTPGGGVSGSMGGAKKRKNGTTQSDFAKTAQGTNAAPGEYIGPGLAYPGNRLPTFNSSHEALGHAAAFPVGLPEFFINAYTDKSDAVFDPFSGSGSTVMASERTDRHGFGMELSPAYVDVSINRWQRLTGKLAVHEETGMTFAALADDRRAVAA